MPPDIEQIRFFFPSGTHLSLFVSINLEAKIKGVDPAKQEGNSQIFFQLNVPRNWSKVFLFGKMPIK